MSDLALNNPLSKYIHSSNNLGDIYHIPNDGSFIIDADEIMKHFLHFEIKNRVSYFEIIVIHRDALKK